mmetsp:Transcript_33754/g.81795  ORF Transcript_33754/g.81795 Transcript_33754/m.81795 type:complete len:660 (+) Transcript_33754:187-2166(+)
MPRSAFLVPLLLLLSLSVFASGVHGELPEVEFQELLGRLQNDPAAIASLRRFTAAPYTSWTSPDSLGTSTPIFANYTFKVVLYHVPPFVVIEDKEAEEGDPGNLNNTRTPGNGKLSGLTIDFLVEIGEQLGCKFEFLYPCKKAYYADNKRCSDLDFRSSAAALTIVKGGVESLLYSGISATFCSDYRCFAAGALKVTEEVIRDFFPTHPYMEKGFKIVVKAQEAQISFMSWAGPFEANLWIVVICEVVFVALIFMITEGYGTNPGLPQNKLGQFLDSFYWSLTILLMVADKAPTTHAGRTLVMTQLFFTLLLIAVYTGNLISFLLNKPLISPMDRFQDATEETAEKFGAWKFCVPQVQTSVGKWLDLQERLNDGLKFERIQALDLVDCVQKVYEEEADVTFYDEPVLLYRMQNNFYSRGKCGFPGGFCSDSAQTDETSCKCPSKDTLGRCLPTDNEWTPLKGNLITRGEVFNPFGYALVFRKGTVTDYMAFGQATQFVKEQHTIDRLENQWIPQMDGMACSTTSNTLITLGLENMQGMIVLTAGIAAIGLAIGLLEHFISVCVKVFPCCACLEKILIDIEAELEREHDHAARGDHTNDGAKRILDHNEEENEEEGEKEEEEGEKEEAFRELHPAADPVHQNSGRSLTLGLPVVTISPRA